MTLTLAGSVVVFTVERLCPELPKLSSQHLDENLFYALAFFDDICLEALNLEQVTPGLSKVQNLTGTWCPSKLICQPEQPAMESKHALEKFLCPADSKDCP